MRALTRSDVREPETPRSAPGFATAVFARKNQVPYPGTVGGETLHRGPHGEVAGKWWSS
jgi:hypothetical protein